MRQRLAFLRPELALSLALHNLQSSFLCILMAPKRVSTVPPAWRTNLLKYLLLIKKEKRTQANQLNKCNHNQRRERAREQSDRCKEQCETARTREHSCRPSRLRRHHSLCAMARAAPSAAKDTLTRSATRAPRHFQTSETPTLSFSLAVHSSVYCNLPTATLFPFGGGRRHFIPPLSFASPRDHQGKNYY